MGEKFFRVQQQMRQDNDELQDYLRDLKNWEKDIVKKDEALKHEKVTDDGVSLINWFILDVKAIMRKLPNTFTFVYNISKIRATLGIPQWYPGNLNPIQVCLQVNLIFNFVWDCQQCIGALLP